MSSSRLTRAAIAGALGVVLLTGAGTTAASWRDSATVGSATITSGRLDVEPVSQSFTVTRPGAASFPLGSAPLNVGDTVTMTSTVVVQASGNALNAILALDTSALSFVVGGVDLRSSASITDTSSLPRAGTQGFRVSGANDGATASATVTWVIPATTDGRARTSNGSNWWGTRLQQQGVDPGVLRWTLVQQP